MADNTFESDYAQNNRSTCKETSCKEKIIKGELRLVKVHKSGFSEDKLARDYYHPKCMFQSFHRVKEGTRIIQKQKDIKGLADLKKSDREKVVKLLEDWKAGKISAPKRGAGKTTTTTKKKTNTTRSKPTKRKREEKPKRPKGVFGGVVFAIECSGRLQLTSKIEDEGGRVVGSITQLVSYVITEDLEAKAAKLQRAKANGKKLVAPEWVDKKIKEGVRVLSSSSSSSSEEEESSSSEEEKKTTKKSGKKDNKPKPPSSSSSSEEEETKNKNKSEAEGKGDKQKSKSKGEDKSDDKSDEESESEQERPSKKLKKGDAPDVSKMVICISGNFQNPRRKRDEISAVLKKAGAKVSDGVNKEVTHLLVSDKTEESGKITKAKEYKIPIVEIDFFGSLF